MNIDYLDAKRMEGMNKITVINNNIEKSNTLHAEENARIQNLIACLKQSVNNNDRINMLDNSIKAINDKIEAINNKIIADYTSKNNELLHAYTQSLESDLPSIIEDYKIQHNKLMHDFIHPPEFKLKSIELFVLSEEQQNLIDAKKKYKPYNPTAKHLLNSTESLIAPLLQEIENFIEQKQNLHRQKDALVNQNAECAEYIEELTNQLQSANISLQERLGYTDQRYLSTSIKNLQGDIEEIQKEKLKTVLQRIGERKIICCKPAITSSFLQAGG